MHLAEWKSKENSPKEFSHCWADYILTKEWPELNIELRQIRKLKYQKERSKKGSCKVAKIVCKGASRIRSSLTERTRTSEKG
jgi:hypothetical protein